MDDLKNFAKSKCEVKGLASTVQISRNDVGMEFRMQDCGVLASKRRKVVPSEEEEMPDGERIKEVPKNGYK